MKQTRIIRIFFLVAAILTVGAFWAGFYFGETGTEPENILTVTEKEEENPPERKTDSEEASDAASGSESKTGKQEQEETAVESMKGVGESRYYLKLSDEYLAVYYSDTDEIYFETGLKPSDLPSDMQEELENGIAFTNLEELYSFLENYSS